MTGDELRKARIELGKLWRKGRPAHASELGRAIGYFDGDPGAIIRHHERARTKQIPAALDCAVRMFLRGVLPPDGIPG